MWNMRHTQLEEQKEKESKNMRWCNEPLGQLEVYRYSHHGVPEEESNILKTYLKKS